MQKGKVKGYLPVSDEGCLASSVVFYFWSVGM